MDEPTATSAAPAARRGLRRIMLGIAIAAVALVLLGIVATWIALASLDSATMRGWIQGGVRQATGLDVSWERMDVSVRGAIRMDGLRIANTAPWADHEPDLLSVARLEADVAPAALLGGRIRVERLALHGVHASWVAGPQGSNLDVLAASPTAPEPEAAPWGLRGPEGLDARVEALAIDGISLAVVSIAEDGTASRLDLGGLVVHGGLALEPDGGILGRLRLVGPEAGALARLGGDGTADVVRAPAREARIIMEGTVEAAGDQAAFRLQADVASQSLTDRLPASFAALGLELAVAEVPDGLRFDLGALDVLAGVVTGRIAAIAGGIDGRLHLPEGALRIDLSALPDGLRAQLPVRLEGPAVLDATARDLVLSAEPPFLGSGGELVVDGTIGLLGADAGGRALTVRTVQSRLSIVPQDGATATLDGSIAAKRITVERDGAPEADLVSPTVALQGTLRAEGTSDIALALGTQALDAAAGDVRLALRDVALRIALPLGRGWPSQGEVTLTLDDSQAWFDGRVLAVPASRLEATLDQVVWDGDAPDRSTGTLGLSGRVGTWSLDAGAVKDARGADVRVVLDAPDLAWVQAVVPRGALAVAWERAGARLEVGGRLGPQAAASDEEDSASDRGFVFEADLAFRAMLADFDAVHRGHRVHVPSATTEGTFQVGSSPLKLHGTLAIPTLAIDGRRTAHGLAGNLRTDLTPARPALVASLRTTGSSQDMHADLEARWTRADRSLHWKLDALLHDPGPLARLLDGLQADLHDLGDARLELRSSGTLAGVVGRMDGLVPVIRSDAPARARGAATLEVRVDAGGQGPAVRVDAGGQGPAVRDGRLVLDLDATTAIRHLRAQVQLPDASVSTKAGRFRVAGLVLDLTASATDLLSRGLVGLDGTLAIGSVTRDDADLAWPVGALSMSVGARLDRLASLRVDRLTLENERSGTRLEATAAVDLPKLPAELGVQQGEGIDRVVGRQAISLQGTLVQDLARVALDPEVFFGTGTVEVPFLLESGDWTVFRVDATVNSTDVSVRVPALPLEISNLNGRTPITEVVAIGPDGLPALVDDGGSNTWSRLRFADQHPFLAGGTDVSMTRLSAGPLTLGPVAGNLRIAGNSLRLDQMEAAWRGGRATGQLILDLVPGNIGVGFRGNVTGIRAGDYDEPLDANAALTASLGTLDVEGRLHLNRIGRGHVRDLLDAFDPYSENTAINRVRKWLALGYPKSVEVEIQHNVLSAGIVLGGIASIVRIDPVRGVPVAPLLRRYIGPLLHKEGGP